MEPRSTRGPAMRLWLPAFTAVVLLFALWGFAPARAAGRVYVTPGGAGARTGVDWANAKDFAPALDAAVAGDELWVAAGVYRPTTGADRSATFQLKAGVAIYGGFAGTETARDQRDWATHVVTLTGDLAGDDQPGFANNADNSYHVVMGASGATLDGVTIAGGNANGTTGRDMVGGGMLNDTSSPALSNVIISGNRADFGGGMFNHNSSPALSNVIISGNHADDRGGGMVNGMSSPTLHTVSITGNSAPSGGGMYNISGSHARLINVTISGNNAQHGGGIHNDTSSPTLLGVTLSGNSAMQRGGGMYNFRSSPALVNVIISGNNAQYGGGMDTDTGDPTFVHVTISGNNAQYGGGIYGYTSNPQIHNSIIWGNSTQINSGVAGQPIVSYSLVQGGLPAGTVDAGGNLSEDPLFVAAVPAAPSTGGDLRLRRASPAVDMASAALLPADADDLDRDGDTAEGLPLDRLGNPRQSDVPGVGIGVLDMGAYEVPPPAVASITRAGASPTRATHVAFVVAFTLPVTGVDAADFALTSTGGQGSASIVEIAGSGTSYVVTAASVAGAIGKLRLDLRDNDTIVTVDAPTVPLGGSGASNGDFVTGEAYTLDRVPPVLGLTMPAPINATNQALYPVVGTCTTGDGDVTVGISTLTAVATCAAGTFSASLDARALADAASVTVGVSQVDAVGNIGSASSITLKDTSAPAGLGLRSSEAPIAGASASMLTVVLGDNLGLDPASLGHDDVSVSGPGDFSAPAELVSQRVEANGTIVAIFSFPAPGGSWDPADNGIYVVRLVAGALKDQAGNLNATTDLGSLRVALDFTTYLPVVRTHHSSRLPLACRERLCYTEPYGSV